MRHALALGALSVALGCTASVAPCPEGTSACGPTYCFDLATDDEHCGACDHACNALERCEMGTCACRDGLARCGDACVMLGTAAHCAGCDDACAAGMTLCRDGACTPCGARGQPCCEGGTCSDADSACSASMGACVACGGAGEPCCDGVVCETGLCRADGTCGACGEVGEACCIDGACAHPVLNVCGSTCVPRNCDGFASSGFGQTWSTRGHCSGATATCTQTELDATACILRDTTHSPDGISCADCALYAWLQCSHDHGCGAEAANLLCCLQIGCPDAATLDCDLCGTEDAALRSCNDRDASHCSRVFPGSAIGQCF